MSKQFRPMLAETCDDVETLKYPVIASPKLDGIRCVIIDGEAYTRKLKPIPNKHVRELLSGLPAFDGEIMMRGADGKFLPFDQVQSAVMSHEGKPVVEFWVFDTTDPHWKDTPFAARADTVKYVIRDGFDDARVSLVAVPQGTLENAAELREYEAACVKYGYEGVMVRSPDGPYKYGRSTVKEGYLLKIKRWHDMEAYVVGFIERQRNDNAAEVSELGLTKRSKKKAGMVPAGDLGALVCNVGGVEFEVGTGFTAAQRISIWENREATLASLKVAPLLVTIKYQELTKDGVPRFPVFKGFRHPHDIGEPT